MASKCETNAIPSVQLVWIFKPINCLVKAELSILGAARTYYSFAGGMFEKNWFVRNTCKRIWLPFMIAIAIRVSIEFWRWLIPKIIDIFLCNAHMLVRININSSRMVLLHRCTICLSLFVKLFSSLLVYALPIYYLHHLLNRYSWRLWSWL